MIRVLPVRSIKAIGFVGSATQDPNRGPQFRLPEPGSMEVRVLSAFELVVELRRWSDCGRAVTEGSSSSSSVVSPRSARKDLSLALKT